MVEIPENPNRRDFGNEVDVAVRSVLQDLGRPDGKVGSLSVNHGSLYTHVMTDVALKVAELFKAKGYHAHWCYSVNGVAYAIRITTYPTEHDI